jgi:acyl-coenzyme A thioesterase PaaI-like protein
MDIARFVEPWGPIFAFNDAGSRRLVPLTPIDREDEYAVIRPREDNACVGCGEANPNSLQLSFLYNETSKRVSTYVSPDIRMQGSLGIVHGGFVSLLLDETMGKCLSKSGLRAPTANLNVTFRKPMQLAETYEISAWIDEQRGRKNFLRAQIVNTSAPNEIVAEATALFITIGQKTAP